MWGEKVMSLGDLSRNDNGNGKKKATKQNE